LISGIVIIPILTAYTFMFFKPEWIPSGTTNNGQLIRPPVQLDQLKLVGGLPQEKWLLVHAGLGDCDLACQEALYFSRQVHTALGKDTSRVERLYLNAGDEPGAEFTELLKNEHPRMLVFEVESEHLRSLFPGIDQLLKGNVVLLIDPNGNVMMSYPAERIGQPMLKDLKHLLRISKIG